MSVSMTNVHVYVDVDVNIHIQYMFRTRRGRDHDVVVVRRTINLGYWEFGMGRDWGGVEKGEVSLQATWDQGGRDPITPRKVSK
jgi:hypothetical protein